MAATKRHAKRVAAGLGTTRRNDAARRQPLGLMKAERDIVSSGPQDGEFTATWPLGSRTKRVLILSRCTLLASLLGHITAPGPRTHHSQGVPAASSRHQGAAGVSLPQVWVSGLEATK